MGFYSAQCPSCKKGIQVPDDADTSRCMYCGELISSNQASAPAAGPSIANLLGMARTAELGGNLIEAESYFNRVLELDPTISEAWIGKGKASGWQSTIVNMRFGEVITAFNHAISTSSKEEQTSTLELCTNEANSLAVALYGLARNHMIEYVSLPNIWVDYLSQINMIFTLLDAAHAWSPADRVTLENIIHLCKDNIEGISYRDQFNNNTAKAWHLSPDYEATIRAKLQATAEKLKLIDPSYIAPSAHAKKPDACFVITATMGDFNHPTVTLLRQFRDQWILKQSGGQRIVDWYYRNGPSIARVIGKSKVLRALSYVIIVAPAARIARYLIR